ncbi:hypothetical protein VN0596_07890 [Helicobacter pylori]
MALWSLKSLKMQESLCVMRNSDKTLLYNKLDTESGKIQTFSQKCADFKLTDFKGHPTWFEPA